MDLTLSAKRIIVELELIVWSQAISKGLEVYGVDGSGYLIHQSRPEHTKDGNADFGAIVADIGFGINGGGW